MTLNECMSHVSMVRLERSRLKFASLAVIGACGFHVACAYVAPVVAPFMLQPQSHVSPLHAIIARLCRIGAYDEAVKSDKPTKPTKPDLRHVRDLRTRSV